MDNMGVVRIFLYKNKILAMRRTSITEENIPDSFLVILHLFFLHFVNIGSLFLIQYVYQKPQFSPYFLKIACVAYEVQVLCPSNQ